MQKGRSWSVAALALAVLLLAAARMGGVEAGCRGPQSCVGEGDLCFLSSSCDDTGMFCDKLCQPGLQCAYTYPEGQRRCVTSTMGAPCTSGLDCLTTFTDPIAQSCSTATYRCVPREGGLLPGDYCTAHDQCTGGSCDLPTNRCNGQPINGPCSADTDCSPRMFC